MIRLLSTAIIIIALAFIVNLLIFGPVGSTFIHQAVGNECWAQQEGASPGVLVRHWHIGGPEAQEMDGYITLVKCPGTE